MGITIAHACAKLPSSARASWAACVAHVLARRDAVESIRLIDENGRVAEGKALDITQAAPLEGFATRVTRLDRSLCRGRRRGRRAGRSGGRRRVVGRRRSDAAQTSRRARATGGRRLRGRVATRARRTRRPRAAACRGRGCSGRRRRRWWQPRGRSSRSSSTSRRADVALSVLGVPPARIVIVWEGGAIGGLAITRVLTEPVRRRLTEKIAALWPTGPYALASAAGKVVEILAGASRQTATCFVAPDDAAGVRLRAARHAGQIGTDGRGRYRVARVEPGRTRRARQRDDALRVLG